MVQERFILRVLGYILTLAGGLTMGFAGFARGHAEEWIIDYSGMAGAILLLNGSALLVKSVWRK